MKTNLFFCLQILCAATLAGCSSMETRTVTIAAEIRKEVADPEFDRKKVILLSRELKDEDFSETQLKRYTLATLEQLSDLSESLTFYFPENLEYVGWQQNTFNEKVRRNASNEHDIYDMYWAYINVRMFDKAAGIREQFPNATYALVPKTMIIGAESATARWPVYDVFDDGDKIELKELHLEAGPKIVVVISAGCPVAERAIKAILADPELAPIFRKHGVLLTLKFDVKGVLRWRQQFDFPNIFIAYKGSRLPEFDFTISPYFYFTKDGKALSSFKGWSKKSFPYFIKGLEAVSIFPANPTPQ